MRNPRNLRFWLLVAIALLVPNAARAMGENWVAWQVHWENDNFVSDGTDESYTNGVRFSFIKHPDFNPRWIEKLPLIPDDYNVNFGIAIGQNFYTPEDLKRVNQDPLERPWAGWLYAGVVIQATDDEERTQRLLEVDFGFVGALALAESSQKGVHEIVNSTNPLGWDNQLEFEPQLNIKFLWRRKIGGSSFDVVPHAGAVVGTLVDYPNVGGTVRVGRHISGFPYLVISPTFAGFAEGDSDLAFGEDHVWEYYFFGAADGRAVLHNVFLDGTNWRESHSIPREDFVYDLKAGLSVRRKNLRATYTFVRRSKEFEPAPGHGDGVHEYASVNFAYERRF